MSVDSISIDGETLTVSGTFEGTRAFRSMGGGSPPGGDKVGLEDGRLVAEVRRLE